MKLKEKGNEKILHCTGEWKDHRVSEEDWKKKKKLKSVI